MEAPISGQILEAAATLLAGAALGMIYDVLRVIRTRSGALAVSLLCDALFCALAGAALFLIGMGPGGGELRLYMPAAALAGAMLYLWFFGAYVRRFTSLTLAALRRAARFLLFPLRKIRDAAKKIREISKNIFSRIEKWVTIIEIKVSGLLARRFRAGEARAEDYDEVQEIRYSYQDSNSGARCIRCYQPRYDEGEDIPGPGGPAAASKAGGRSA